MTTAMKLQWDRLVEFASRERCLIGASVLRVLAGLAILYQYLINYGQRDYLFGPNGLFPFAEFEQALAARGTFSLYALSPSELWFQVVYHAGIVVALLWVVGWRTRLMTPLNYLLWLSLHNRFDLLWDGGDNVMQIVFVYAIFADVGAYFSFDGERRRRAAQGQQGLAVERGFGPRALAMLHNTAMLAIAIQICLVYGVAGLTKVQGETWQNGTALYHALRGAEFRLPGVSEAIFHNATLLTLLAYATVAFQVSFTFLFFMNRWTRRLAIAAGLVFHLGIGGVMGLITFATFLIAVDLSLVTDNEYHALARLARRATAWIPRVRARARVSSTANATNP